MDGFPPPREALLDPNEQPQPAIDVSSLMRDFLDREETSRRYQAQLELRVSDDSVRLQQERYRCGELEGRIADVQWAKGRVEAQLAQISDIGDILQQQIAMERSRCQDLESRITTLSALNDTLIKTLADYEPVARDSQQKPLNAFHIYLENLGLQETIKELQSKVNLHEQTIRSLRSIIEVAMRTYPWCSDCDGSDVSTIVPEAQPYDTFLPPELSPCGPDSCVPKESEQTLTE